MPHPGREAHVHEARAVAALAREQHDVGAHARAPARRRWRGPPLPRSPALADRARLGEQMSVGAMLAVQQVAPASRGWPRRRTRPAGQQAPPPCLARMLSTWAKRARSNSWTSASETALRAAASAMRTTPTRPSIWSCDHALRLRPWAAPRVQARDARATDVEDRLGRARACVWPSSAPIRMPSATETAATFSAVYRLSWPQPALGARTKPERLAAALPQPLADHGNEHIDQT